MTTLFIVAVRNSSTSTDPSYSFDLVHGDVFDKIIDQGSLRFDAYTSTQDLLFTMQTQEIKSSRCRAAAVVQSISTIKEENSIIAQIEDDKREDSTPQQRRILSTKQDAMRNTSTPRPGEDALKMNKETLTLINNNMGISNSYGFFTLPQVSSVESIVPINFSLTSIRQNANCSSSSLSSEKIIPPASSTEFKADAEGSRNDKSNRISAWAASMERIHEEAYSYATGSSFTNQSYENFATSTEEIFNKKMNKEKFDKYVLLHDVGDNSFSKKNDCLSY